MSEHDLKVTVNTLLFIIGDMLQKEGYTIESYPWADDCSEAIQAAKQYISEQEHGSCLSKRD